MAGKVEKLIGKLLVELGEDPTREGLIDTPPRVAESYRHWLGGYHIDAARLVKAFSDGANGDCDEIIVVSGIRLYSLCEHHLAPFFGVAHVGYLPDKKIVGLSKLPRIVDAFARRLQVQERLTNQVVDAIEKGLACRGVGCVIHARHFCMESRGVCQPGTVTTTSALRGAFRAYPELRAEFFSLVPKIQDTRI